VGKEGTGLTGQKRDRVTISGPASISLRKRGQSTSRLAGRAADSKTVRFVEAIRMLAKLCSAQYMQPSRGGSVGTLAQTNACRCDLGHSPLKQSDPHQAICLVALRGGIKPATY